MGARLDKRHKWKPLRQYKYITTYKCVVCGRRGSSFHNWLGKFSELLKQRFAPKMVKQLNCESPLLEFFTCKVASNIEPVPIKVRRNRE